MAISSNATGLRPGVCTSTTRPTTPYTGQIIYETDTGYLRVWDGSAWDYLSAKQDTTEGLPAETYMGLVKVIPTSVSSAGGTAATMSATGTVTVGSGNTSVDLRGCFSSLYENYRIVFSNITPSQASQDLNLQLLSGSTAATTNYNHGFIYVTLVGGTVVGVGSASTSSFIVSSVNSTAFRHSNASDVFMPNLAQYTAFWSTAYLTRTDIASSSLSGHHASATAYDGITIKTSAGSISGGTIRVYGYRN